MRNLLLRLAAASLLVAIVGACGTTVPVGGGTVVIKTAPKAPDACMEALLGGTLAINNQSGLGVTSPDGEAMAVEWPFGYTARNEGGRAVLVDETGKMVAKVGDVITVGGGFGNQFWHACAPVTVTKAAP